MGYKNMSLKTVTSADFQIIVLEFIKENPSCTLSDIVSCTGIDYTAAKRIIHGRADLKTNTGLIVDGFVIATPSLSNGRLCWRYFAVIDSKNPVSQSDAMEA
jgi:hypothetical protein